MYIKQGAERAARKEAVKKQKAENKVAERAWGKTARSALALLYDQPVNAQAAKDLCRKPWD